MTVPRPDGAETAERNDSQDTEKEDQRLGLRLVIRSSERATMQANPSGAAKCRGRGPNGGHCTSCAGTTAGTRCCSSPGPDRGRTLRDPVSPR